MPDSETSQELYSSWVGLIYVFNLIVGTGALTLPAAFAKAGWLLSLILLILLAVVSFITVTFIIESIACANATLQWRKIQSHKVDGENEVIDSDSEFDESNEQTAIIQSTRNRSRYFTLNEKVELGQMAALYFNKWGRLCFYLALCVYLYGDLAIYAAAIGKSLSDLVCPSKNMTSEDFSVFCWESSDIRKIDLYRMFVGMFAAFVGPFTYFNVQKTKYLQMITTTMRWCAFTIMVTLAVVRLCENGQQGHPNLFEFSGVPALLGASVYSFMCHHSLPGLVAPFAEKQYVIKQLALDYFLICSFYILLALTGTFAFSELNDLYTLNFLPSSDEYSGVFMKIILYFLSLFPVFTLSTSFPIISITLQNNLKSLFLDVNSIDRYSFILRKLTFPTLAVVPPIIIALGTHNLHSLVKFTGAYAGACIQYFVPAFLVWTARKDCTKEFGMNSNNKYASIFKGDLWILFVVCWSLTCVILVTVNLTK